MKKILSLLYEKVYRFLNLEFFFIIVFSVVSCLSFHISDSVDSKTTMEALKVLVTNANIYMDETLKAKRKVDPILLRNVASYITCILKVNSGR